LGGEGGRCELRREVLSFSPTVPTIIDNILPCCLQSFHRTTLRRLESVCTVNFYSHAQYYFCPHTPTTLVRKARKEAQSYYREYRETKPVGQLVKSTASVMQEYTQSGGVRPFGVSLLVAGMDGDGVPRLFQVDPSGAYFGWKATAIGKVRERD